MKVICECKYLKNILVVTNTCTDDNFSSKVTELIALLRDKERRRVKKACYRRKHRIDTPIIEYDGDDKRFSTNSPDQNAAVRELEAACISN